MMTRKRHRWVKYEGEYRICLDCQTIAHVKDVHQGKLPDCEPKLMKAFVEASDPVVKCPRCGARVPNTPLCLRCGVRLHPTGWKP